MTPLNLTPELQQQIVASIRSGCYGHVAAEAWGIPRRLFLRWLKHGRGRNAPDLYAHFAAEVRTAQAQARLRAEVAAFDDDAKVWLEHGPGRETPDNPGWTAPVKPGADVSHEPGSDLLMQPRFTSLCQLVLQVLVPFPDARARLADALTEWNKNKPFPHTA